MRRPGGYALVTRSDGRHIECDTFTCKHCNRIVHVRPKQDPAELGGMCKVCSGLVCSECVGKGCDEIQRKLDRWEASYHARRSYGM